MRRVALRMRIAFDSGLMQPRAMLEFNDQSHVLTRGCGKSRIEIETTLMR
jgi:hypothetical protein